MKILAIETSCDETAAAVVESGVKVLSSVISSQVDIHKRFGGVVPEIASRNHTVALPCIVDEALSQAGLALADVDAVAVTYGSGLLGALLTGVSYAKGLAYATKKPLVAVSHIKGHIAANYIAHEGLSFPYICVMVSGGHSSILKVTDYDEIESLGATHDDAAGEVFDKVARALGLPYPGGPEIQRLASGGKRVIRFARQYDSGKGSYDFSFSGLKTAVLSYLTKNLPHLLKDNKDGKGNCGGGQGEKVSLADVAASFQAAVAEQLVSKCVAAAVDNGIMSVALSGGVGANVYLRELLQQKCEQHGITAYFLPLYLCTDNAAMIAAEAYFMLKKQKSTAGLDLDAEARVGFSNE